MYLTEAIAIALKQNKYVYCTGGFVTSGQGITVYTSPGIVHPEYIVAIIGTLNRNSLLSNDYTVVEKDTPHAG